MEEQNEGQQMQEGQPASPQQPEGQQADQGPQQFNYEDYDAFQRDRTQWMIQQNQRGVADAVRQGIREGINPPVSPDLPDDEYREKRQEARKWEKDCLQKAELAQRSGDPAKAQEWRERSHFLTDEVGKLGPSKAEQVAEENEWRQRFEAVANLGEARLDNHPVWETDRMRHDAPVMVHSQNKNSKNHILVMPAEETPWGPLKPLRPSTAMFVQLPDEKTYRRIRDEIYNSGGPQDSGSLFRRAWDVLHRTGFDALAQPTIKAPPARPSASDRKKEELVDDPAEMSQKEYEAWRKKQGARPF